MFSDRPKSGRGPPRASWRCTRGASTSRTFSARATPSWPETRGSPPLWPGSGGGIGPGPWCGCRRASRGPQRAAPPIGRLIPDRRHAALATTRAAFAGTARAGIGAGFIDRPKHLPGNRRRRVESGQAVHLLPHEPGPPGSSNRLHLCKFDFSSLPVGGSRGYSDQGEGSSRP
jgi:hypothetical protein